MDKDEILEKSRSENKNRDVYEQEISLEANTYALIVLLALATVFFVVQVFTGGGINYGIYAIVFSGHMTTAWVKYIKLKRKKDILLAIPSTLLVLGLSAGHIYDLVASSGIV